MDVDGREVIEVGRRKAGHRQDKHRSNAQRHVLESVP
jgi:hypothetical protein